MYIVIFCEKLKRILYYYSINPSQSDLGMTGLD